MIYKFKGKIVLPAILSGTSIIISIMLLELVLAGIGFSYKLYPDKVEFGWPDNIKLEKIYKRDTDLLWVPKNYQKKLNRYRNDPAISIVFMGDSCTQFGSYDSSFARFVKDEYPESDLRYANMGVGGWSSYQGLQQMKRDIIKIHPRVATIYYGWNDHWFGFGVEDKNVAKIGSFFSKLQRFRVVQLLTKAFIVADQTDKPNRVSVIDFKNNLIDIIKIARGNNIIPVLITAPTSHERGKEPEYLTNRWLRSLNDLIPLHQKYISLVREVANEENAYLLDLAKKFEELPKNVVRDQYFMRDGIHLKKAGNEIIGRMMVDFFLDNGLIEQVLQQQPSQ